MEEDTYISLQEASKYCSYTQEYLSLRARQGKLKSVKFGRNWVTKKEWLEEYFNKIQKSNIKNQKFVNPPENLPIEKLPVPKLRFAFVTALVFVLLTAGIVFGKESFKNVYQDLDPVVREISEATDLAVKEIFDSTKNIITLATEGAGIAFQNLSSAISTAVENTLQSSQEMAKISVPAVFELITENLKEFSQWLVRQPLAVGQKIVEVYTTANDFVEQKLSDLVHQPLALGQKIVHPVRNTIFSVPDFVRSVISNGVEGYLTVNNFVEQKLSGLIHPVRNVFSKTPNFIKSVISNGVKSYLTANDFVERKISQGIMGLKKIPEIVTQPFRPKIIVIEKLPPEAEKNITELQGKVKELEEKIPKEVVKEKEVEVSRVTKIEPVKEITRETIVTKIDEAELAKLKAQTAQFSLWGTDIENLRAITKKLQATPTYTPAPSAPIYIGYQGIQVGGTGTFASLGVSGSAGIGDLGVGGSTSLGSSSADTLTVNAASYLKSPVTFGTGALTIDTSGNLTTTGIVTLANTTRADQFEISVNSEGKVIFDASSGRIQLAAGNNFYTEDGGPIGRAVGEEIFRAAVPIYRYGMPSQTSNSTNFVRVSKYFATTSDISIPAALTGTTRVYRLVINYSDDIPVASSSSWQIVNSAGTTVHATFTLPGQNATTLEEGKPFLTGLVAIPDTDWQVEVKMPTGKNIRIFQIYLVVYDQVQ